LIELDGAKSTNEKSRDGDTPARTKGPRVTRIGYFALGLSIAAALGLYGQIVAVNSVDLFVWVDSLPEGGYSLFYGVFHYYILSSSIAAITVDIVAGTRGRGNRIAGVVGGLLVLSPLVFMLVVLGLSLLL
jgi:hypothetical protein